MKYFLKGGALEHGLVPDRAGLKTDNVNVLVCTFY